MKVRQPRYAVLALVASLSVLAACSNEDDSAAPVVSDSGTMTQPSPAATPAPATPPTPSDPSIESGPTESSSELGQTDTSPELGQTDSTMSEDKSTGEKVAEKAGEIRDDTADAAGRLGNTIKEGARDANEAIQDTFSKGTPPENSPEAEEQAGQ